MPDIYQKSGYLNSPFRLFYLEDLPGREYAYHYHDFHKLLIFLNGTVSYRVEGREYAASSSCGCKDMLHSTKCHYNYFYTLMI